MDTPSLLDLPSELIPEIRRFLPFRARACLRSTCRALAKSDPFQKVVDDAVHGQPFLFCSQWRHQHAVMREMVKYGLESAVPRIYYKWQWCPTLPREGGEGWTTSLELWGLHGLRHTLTVQHSSCDFESTTLFFTRLTLIMKQVSSLGSVTIAIGVRDFNSVAEFAEFLKALTPYDWTKHQEFCDQFIADLPEASLTAMKEERTGHGDMTGGRIRVAQRMQQLLNTFKQ